MKVLVSVLLAIVLALIGALVFVLVSGPSQRPASTERVEITPARLQRGKYLAEAVLGCFDCHSDHDYEKYGAPAIGPAGAGGICMTEAQGFPGDICMPNITPDTQTGLGGWTDGEIMRAIREGVDRNGKALFPLMPYRQYAAISDEDTRAVVAYLRSLPPVNKATAERRVDLHWRLGIKLVPRALEGPVPEPNRQDRVAYGQYLAKVSGCLFCHTPVNRTHEPISGMEFAGGQELPGGVRSPNLTPHPTGMGDRTEAQFVAMFKAFEIPAGDLPAVPVKDNTQMPWLSRAKLTEADLGAIYAYLRTVRPVDRVVQKRPLPKLPAR